MAQNVGLPRSRSQIEAGVICFLRAVTVHRQVGAATGNWTVTVTLTEGQENIK